ncbi:hypothetical protein PanWU01x14_018560 [Parasponia andersonii]|uniref:Uncharacterized protein n=1 Tax=Parasponia andersonii TaxID=3476 RepID=A0A2P5DZ70_PARAD|nr:hypothetical protein PanWU01x14_018560 [Parasponia andersonii]
MSTPKNVYSFSSTSLALRGSNGSTTSGGVSSWLHDKDLGNGATYFIREGSHRSNIRKSTFFAVNERENRERLGRGERV